MQKYYLRTFKRFLENKKFLMMPLILALSLTYMASGYCLLKETLRIEGTAKISEEIVSLSSNSKICDVDLTFQETNNWPENNFAFDITITNNSPIIYQGWRLKIWNPGYIVFPNWIQENHDEQYFFIDSEYSISKINPNETVKIPITFEVLNDIKSVMTLRDAAIYFVNNYIYFDECNQSAIN